jgi:integrase
MDAANKKLEPTGLLAKPAALITPQDILAAYDAMLQRTDKKRSHAGGHTQAAQAMRYARAVLRFGLKERIGGNLPDPFEAIPERQRWKQPKANTRTVIDKEGGLARWWKAIEGLRAKTDGRAAAQSTIADYAILTLLWGTRRSEILGLRWKDVDFESRSVSIGKTKTTPREIPLAPYAEMILRRRLGDENRDGTWVFPSNKTGHQSKTRTHIQEPRATLMEVATTSGIDFTTHDLRRTFGTLLGETGASYYQTKAAMHHAASGDVTQKHYMRIRLKALRLVFENLEKAILEEAGVTNA